jgi:hypothetical protein
VIVLVSLKGNEMSWKTLLLAVTLLFSGCGQRETEMPHNGTPTLSREQLLGVGKGYASSMELSLDDVQVTFDEGNEGWDEYFAWLRQEDDPEVIRAVEMAKARLHNRDFQAIHVAAGPDIMGGPWWLLVDKHTAERLFAIEEFWREQPE